jgi:hypothetical protein
MKRFLFAAAIIFANSAAYAEKVTYRPFTYETNCYLENASNGSYQEDLCKVVETREKGGALRTRNIYSNRFSLTIKSWFDKKQGFMTWDSHNKFNYKWDYKVGGGNGIDALTYVMPGFLVENVSWD